MKEKQSNFFAIALILIGCALLLHQLQIISLSWSVLSIVISFFLGVLWLRKAAMHPQRNGILGGTFWLLTGIMLLLMYQNIIPKDDILGAGLLMFILAVANLVRFAFVGRNINNITSAVLLMIVSACFLVVYFNYLSRWEVLDLVYVYWPVLLIIGGIALVAEGIIKRA